MSRIALCKFLLDQSFFIDKFVLSNVFQVPKILTTRLNLTISPSFKSKAQLCKLLILFYAITGQKPKVAISNCSLRGLKKKKIRGFCLTFRKNSYFLKFIALRQLALGSFFRPLVIGNSTASFSFAVQQKTQDDDLLLQTLKISESFNYQVYLHTNVSTSQLLQALLIRTKLPCCA